LPFLYRREKRGRARFHIRIAHRAGPPRQTTLPAVYNWEASLPLLRLEVIREAQDRIALHDAVIARVPHGSRRGEGIVDPCGRFAEAIGSAEKDSPLQHNGRRFRHLATTCGRQRRDEIEGTQQPQPQPEPGTRPQFLIFPNLCPHVALNTKGAVSQSHVTHTNAWPNTVDYKLLLIGPRNLKLGQLAVCGS
jgi:hypothetical protein